ncbi:MAG: lysophospholipid acyltransferase family protein [Gemmatimonadaceae bacterium]
MASLTIGARPSRLDRWPDPTPDELAALSGMERLVFRVAWWMNRGRAKAFWGWYQRAVSARLVSLVTRRRLCVYGIGHAAAASLDRPVLLVANHRSFFDMYVVSSVLLLRAPGDRHLFFPVRGRFFYSSPLALLLNAFAGWAMFPPIFHEGSKRAFNHYSMRLLAALCRAGRGHVIGVHPEGARNRGADPYSYLRAQSGVGRLIHDAAPQVIPVFIVGLGNSLVKEIAANWRGGESIRIHFGEQIDPALFSGKEPHARTYREITDLVMRKIAELGDQDRAMYGSSGVARSGDARTVPGGETSSAERAS